jgi:sec-independent protein translocase protein TatC
VLGLVVGTGICIAIGEQLLAFLTEPYIGAMAEHGYTPEMLNLDPTETFVQYFKTCIIFGLGLSSPYSMYQLWRFVAAGLYPHERRWVTMFAPASLVLFFTGVVFLIKLVLPAVLYFMISTTTWVPNPRVSAGPQFVTSAPSSAPMRAPILNAPPETPHDGDVWISAPDGALNWVIGDTVLRLHGRPLGADRLVRPTYSLQMYLSFVNGLCFAFGVGFQVPIVVVVLVLLRIVTAAELAGLRRYVIMGIVVGAAILTPPDVTSQMLLAGPMIVLFELGLYIGRLVETKRPAP